MEALFEPQIRGIMQKINEQLDWLGKNVPGEQVVSWNQTSAFWPLLVGTEADRVCRIISYYQVVLEAQHTSENDYNSSSQLILTQVHPVCL